jgi:ribonuclease M5
MLKINEIIVVEGKYDKIAVENVVDTLIIETNGFSIFNDSELKSYIKKLSEERGIIILTDSDASGFKIRNYITGFINADKIKHAYIADLYGKEKRKHVKSKVGKIGVEGIGKENIINALKNSGIFIEESDKKCKTEIKPSDLYQLGISGGEHSSILRREVCKSLGLPQRLSTKRLCMVLELISSLEEIKNIIDSL